LDALRSVHILTPEIPKTPTRFFFRFILKMIIESD